MQLNNIVIISGPSGAGEDTIIKEISKRTPINRVITTTTREKRKGEDEGKPYHFISEDVFKEMIADEQFVEWAEEYNNELYGVTKDELERVNALEGLGIWKIEYKGVQKAKKLFPDVTAILINAPIETLSRRIRARDNATQEHIRIRTEYTKEWLKHTDVYDYVVENDDGKLDEAIHKIMDILQKEKYL